MTCRRRVEIDRATVDRATLLFPADGTRTKTADFGQLRSRRLQIRPVDESRQNPRFKAIEVPEFDSLLLELSPRNCRATIACARFTGRIASLKFRGRDGVQLRRKHLMSRIQAPRAATEVDTSLNVPRGATEEASAEEAMEEAEKTRRPADRNNRNGPRGDETRGRRRRASRRRMNLEKKLRGEAPVSQSPSLWWLKRNPSVVESAGGILTLDLLTYRRFEVANGDWTFAR